MRLPKGKSYISKYRNKKTVVDGIQFDSKKEADRYRKLKLLEEAGEILDLHRQVHYLLIPEQREFTGEFYSKGPNKGKQKPGKLLERKVEYIADFDYYLPTGEHIVEDTKGIRTKDYILKRKMMLYFHHIKISEI